MSAVRHISCAEAVSRLYEYLDKEAEAFSMKEIEQHLEICRHCCSRFSFEATLWKVVRMKGRQQPPCPEDLKKKIQALLDSY